MHASPGKERRKKKQRTRLPNYADKSSYINQAIEKSASKIAKLLFFRMGGNQNQKKKKREKNLIKKL
jgi:hypothetical protein